MNDTLPALPESVGRKCINAGRGRHPVCDVYTADQMHAYARAALEQREAEVREVVAFANDGVADALTELECRATAAESRLGAVEAFAQRLATDRSYSGDIVEDLRAALSGDRINDFLRIASGWIGWAQREKTEPATSRLMIAGPCRTGSIPAEVTRCAKPSTPPCHNTPPETATNVEPTNMPYTRCSKCEHRRTLPRRPESYLRLPKCRGCGRTMTLDGKPEPGSRQSPSRVARYRIDKYRHQVERAGGHHYAKPCNPGRGGCSGYHFPHRRGSLFCDHNPNLTADDLRVRWGH